MTKKIADPWIVKFKKEGVPKLVKEFKPAKVILFGSRVQGTAKKGSDIDVILVSPCFEDMPFLKRMPFVLKKLSFPKHVDYICYTPVEYERMKVESCTIRDALENALEIMT